MRPEPREKAAPVSLAQGLVETFLEQRAALSNLVRRLLGRGESPDDVLQETIARAMEAARHHAILAPRAYLFTTARHLALKERRRQSLRLTESVEELLNSPLTTAGGSVEDEVEVERMLALFETALASLAPQCRKVYILRKVYGLSHKEISQLLGISAKTIERHIAKAIVRCGEVLEARGYQMSVRSTPGPPRNARRQTGTAK